MSDERWMRRVLDLARRGVGRAAPNPMVGALVVRGGKVVGEGYHRFYGGAHAEVEAFRQAGARTRGATLYVNLEPCSHWGKTPPCSEAVIESGIKRVVAAMRDPNPKVSGRGFNQLRRAGIAVDFGLLESEAKELNRAFVATMTWRRPYVTLKAAVSLDGKIATTAGDSQWITGPEARARGHALRAEVGAVMVGVNTLLQDNPLLTAHGKGRDPIRVIFDSQLRTPPSAKIFNDPAPVWILTAKTSPAAQARLEAKGACIQRLPARRGRIDIYAALRFLNDQKISHVLVEGGGTLNASFVEADLVDEVFWFIAPTLIGGTDARTAIEGRGLAPLRKALSLRLTHVERVGNDLLVRAARR